MKPGVGTSDPSPSPSPAPPDSLPRCPFGHTFAAYPALSACCSPLVKLFTGGTRVGNWTPAASKWTMEPHESTGKILPKP